MQDTISVVCSIGARKIVFFETTVRGVQLASLDPASGNTLPRPFVKLEYSLAQMSYLMPFLRDCAQARVEPQVYLWDLHLPNPEVLVIFDLTNPSRNLIRSTLRKTHHLIEGAWDSLKTTAAANLDRDARVRFLDLYRNSQSAGIVILEEGTLPAEIAAAALFAFPTSKVFSAPPPPILEA